MSRTHTDEAQCLPNVIRALDTQKVVTTRVFSAQIYRNTSSVMFKSEKEELLNSCVLQFAVKKLVPLLVSLNGKAGQQEPVNRFSSLEKMGW